MEGLLLCYVCGFSSGFLCRMIKEKKYNSNRSSNRVHQFRDQHTSRVMTSRNNNLIVTQQPQQATRYNGDMNVPIAQARLIVDP